MKKAILGVLGVSIVVMLASVGCQRDRAADKQEVVVYVSEDQVFSEPILADFERDTGIHVLAVYDTEEAKSTGAMNRLIAEKNNPQADVYWANEPIRAEVLKQRGISAPYKSPNGAGIADTFKDPDGYWTGFSARARVLVVNEKLKQKPDTILAYTDPRWKGRMVIANPLFGTTTSQVAALFTLWGNARGEEFLDQMKANDVAVSTSNGESSDFVAAGERDFSLVDSDDVVSRIKRGRPVEMVYPDQGKDQIGCMIVPNAAVLIEGAPHPDAARKLIDYLLSKETERKLAFADCAQIPLHAGVPTPDEVRPIEETHIMQVDYSEVAEKMQEIQPLLKEWAGY